MEDVYQAFEIFFEAGAPEPKRALQVLAPDPIICLHDSLDGRNITARRQLA